MTVRKTEWRRKYGSIDTGRQMIGGKTERKKRMTVERKQEETGRR